MNMVKQKEADAFVSAGSSGAILVGGQVIVGASLLKLVKHGFAFTGVEVAIMIVGMLVAFAVSIFAIKFLMQYIKKHDFKAFGWYRIVLGVIVLLYFVIKTVILKA